MEEADTMGLLDNFRQKRQLKKAGGNFAWIAQNVAAIYYAVPLTPFGKTLPEEQRLFAAGLIDAVAYLQEGSLTPQDIQDAVLWGQTGTVGLGFYNRRHREMFESEDNQELLGMTMQLEARFFELSDAGIDYHDIVDVVVMHKDVIAETIRKTVAEGSRCPIFREVMQNTTIAMASPGFQQLVLSYSRKT